MTRLRKNPVASGIRTRDLPLWRRTSSGSSLLLSERTRKKILRYRGRDHEMKRATNIVCLCSNHLNRPPRWPSGKASTSRVEDPWFEYSSTFHFMATPPVRSAHYFRKRHTGGLGPYLKRKAKTKQSKETKTSRIPKANKQTNKNNKPPPPKKRRKNPTTATISNKTQTTPSSSSCPTTLSVKCSSCYLL